MAKIEETIKYKTDDDGHVYRCYDHIKTKPIERCDYKSKEVTLKIKKQLPIIIENSEILASAKKWDLDYLVENLGTDKKNVFKSDSCKFMYFNEKRSIYMKNFQPPIRQEEMTTRDFAKRVRAWKPGEERLYYQQMLTDTVGPKIFDDFRNFRWNWLAEKQNSFNWGDLTSNLLLIGQPGNITPVHYDEQQNFFGQVKGYKRVLLFHPKYFQCLYPYPFHHPCDRQSQVDFDNPDYEKFPLSKHLYAYEAVVGPGDILYIPMFWWHYIESTMDSELTVSVNFWYKHTTMTLEDLKTPLSWQQKTTMARNIEKMLCEALGSPSEIGPFLHAILSGRYESRALSDEDFDF